MLFPFNEVPWGLMLFAARVLVSPWCLAGAGLAVSCWLSALLGEGAPQVGVHGCPCALAQAAVMFSPLCQQRGYPTGLWGPVGQLLPVTPQEEGNLSLRPTQMAEKGKWPKVTF